MKGFRSGRKELGGGKPSKNRELGDITHLGFCSKSEFHSNPHFDMLRDEHLREKVALNIGNFH